MGKTAFISYSHEDESVFCKIREQLEKIRELQFWYDGDLRGGEKYLHEIAVQIEAREYFMILISEHSVNSDWCEMELTYALSTGRKMIAIWLEDCQVPSGIKMAIQHTQYVLWKQNAPEAFLKDMELAFEGKSLHMTAAKSDEEESGEAHQFHYFMTADQCKVMDRLLKEEAQKHYSVCFKPENCVYLGLAYEQGYHVPKDPKRAEVYYVAGGYYGNLDCKYLEAANRLHLREYLGSADRQQLQEVMRKAAEGGSLLAKTDLAGYYYKGSMGFPRDREQAYRWWAEAAEQNDPTALYMMAYGHYMFQVEKPDPRIALMFAYRAMEYRFPRAHRITGWMYENGSFLERDLDKALNCFRKATEEGDYLAFSFMGRVAEQLDRREEAEMYYRKSVEKIEQYHRRTGGMAHHFLALFLQDEKRFEEASEYFLEGAGRNYLASRDLAVSCIGKVPDLRKQIPLLLKADIKGCLGAQWSLANLYRDLAMEIRKEHPMTEEGTMTKEEQSMWEQTGIWLQRGTDEGDINCNYDAILAFSWALNSGVLFGMKGILGERRFPKEMTDYSKALRSYRKLFSLRGDRELDGIWYLGYALELDNHSKEQPNYDHSVKYYRMALEQDFRYLIQVSAIAALLIEPDEKGTIGEEEKGHAWDLYREMREIIGAEGIRNGMMALSENEKREVYDHLLELERFFADRIGSEETGTEELQNRLLSYRRHLEAFREKRRTEKEGEASGEEA